MWTPLIIRFSWYVALVLSLLWIVFLSIAFAGSAFSGEQSSLLDSFGIPDLSMSSLDVEGVLNGKADVDSLNQFLDGVTQQGSATPKPKPKSAYQSLLAFTFSGLSFVTLIASLILSVLFCRVFFETIIAIFDISSTLKSINEKSG